MITTTKLTWQERVKVFAENKTFQFLTSVKVKRGEIKCDACGSKLLQNVDLMVDNNGKYFLVGQNCYGELFNTQHIKFQWHFDGKVAKQIAEKLVAEWTGNDNEFYPFTCTSCSCEITKDDAKRFSYRCKNCWYEQARENER